MERKAREAKRAGQAGPGGVEMKACSSPRIDDHDRQFKVERARGFLSQGHPVRMVVRFLGRDMRHPEVGMKALQEALAELGKMLPITVDQQPRMEGRQLSRSSVRPKAPSCPRSALTAPPAPTPPGPQDARLRGRRSRGPDRRRFGHCPGDSGRCPVTSRSGRPAG